MKNLLIAAVLLLATMNNVNAQAPAEKEVAAAVETLRKAMVDADKKTLEAITAAELSYGHSSGTIEDKAAFVDALVTGKSDFLTMDLTKQTIQVVGNTALVRHELHGDVPNGKVDLGILLVWQKQKGKWLLLARQAYKI